MSDPKAEQRRIADLGFENSRLHLENARLQKGRVVVPVLLMAATFIAGLMIQFSFLATPQPDLQAEYCRGMSDGMVWVQGSAYEYFKNIEDQAAAAGMESVMVVRDPVTGEVMESVKVTETIVPQPTADYGPANEASCIAAAPEDYALLGLRGPSDVPPVPAPTAPTAPVAP